MGHREPQHEMEPPQPLPPWLIDEIERERAIDAERPALNIDGDAGEWPLERMPREKPSRDAESAHEAPPSVVVIIQM